MKMHFFFAEGNNCQQTTTGMHVAPHIFVHYQRQRQFSNYVILKPPAPYSLCTSILVTHACDFITRGPVIMTRISHRLENADASKCSLLPSIPTLVTRELAMTIPSKKKRTMSYLVMPIGGFHQE